MKTKKGFASQFKPAKKHHSDKFSWRFYQRILKNGREKVYLMAWSPIDGIRELPEKPPKDFISASSLAVGRIGDMGFFHGATLGTICTPNAPLHDWAYHRGFNTEKWIDVTEWFWRNYKRKGRCLFYRSTHSWVEINRNSRKCAYCETLQVRKVITEKRIERYETWHSQPTLGGGKICDKS